jgi:hypothetical protein
MIKEFEGLQLSDLKFDDNGVFDAFEAGKKEEGGAAAPDIKNPGEQQNNDSDGKVIPKPGQESVASDKDNQGKDGKTADGGNSSSPQQTANDKLFASLAAELKTKGVLPNLDLENNSIKSLDDIRQAISAEITGGLNDKQKAISKAMDLGLDTESVSQQLDTISKLKAIPPDFLNKEGNDSWRKDVIVQDFVNKGIDKVRADVMAQASIDAGTGIQDATTALADIIKREETSYDNKIQTAQGKEDKNASDIKAYINKDQEILPGVKLNSQEIEEIHQKITTDLGNKENAFIQAQKKDPIASRIKLEVLFHLTKGLTDFSRFSQAGEKAANTSFENLLRGSSFGEDGNGTGGVSGGDDDSFSLKDLNDAGLKFV